MASNCAWTHLWYDISTPFNGVLPDSWNYRPQL